MTINQGLNPSVVFVSQDSTVQNVAKQMIEHEISSVLVTRSDDCVIGIITERDFVRKFVLLETPDKLNLKAETLMSTPVICASAENLQEDVLQIFKQKKLRHFPIAAKHDGELKKQDIVGIMSTSDIIHALAIPPPAPTADKKVEGTKGPEAKAEDGKLQFALLSKNPSHNQTFKTIFEKLNFSVVDLIDFHSFVRKHPDQKLPILADLDGLNQHELSAFMQNIAKYRGGIIFATSDPSLAQGLKRVKGGLGRIVTIKPLDISYCNWVMRVHWHAPVVKAPAVAA